MRSPTDPDRGRPQRTPPSTDDLTPRQLEVVKAYDRLLSAAAVGEALGLSVRTVDKHLENARRRGGCDRTADLVFMLSGGRRGLPRLATEEDQHT